MYKLINRSHNDHRTQACLRQAPSSLEAEPILTLRLWQHYYGLRLFDSKLAEVRLRQEDEAVPEPDRKQHQDKVALHSLDPLLGR